MSEEILINVLPQETRVALVENGMVQQVLIERDEQRGCVGSVFRGRVSRVLPGMQAAFVDIGLVRAAFLHANDIFRKPVNSGQNSAENGAQMREEIAVPDITQMLREGQDLVVQVIKDPIGTKGARLTTSISIPSRYLVLLPNAGHVGVSIRIEDEAERERLKALVEVARDPDSADGYIVRTNAEGADEQSLRSDIVFLHKLWHCIQDNIKNNNQTKCVFEDLRLSRRALRDMMSARVEKVRIDSKLTFEKTLEFARQFVPEWVDRVEHYPGERPIFDLYGAEDEIARALERTAPLKSGGHIVIDQTEAMTTIDVNTGGFVGHKNLEETIYKTNLEAAQTIARQLRLRNLGGIIILDFIDMQVDEHKRQVLRTLEKALARDPARTGVCPISPLGLVEMTRKRTTESLEQMLCEPCTACAGKGIMKTTKTVCFEIFREILRAVRQFDAEHLLVLAAPEVVTQIMEEESTAVAELEQFLEKSIRFQAEDQYGQEQYDVVLL